MNSNFKKSNYLIYKDNQIISLLSQNSYILNNQDSKNFQSNNLYLINDKSKNDLIQNKILVERGVDELDQLLREYEALSNDDALYLIIVATTECNFNCKYCYEEYKNPSSIDNTFADSIYEYIKKNIDMYKSVYIDWFGGEPLLRYDVIIYLSHKLKKTMQA